MNSLWNFSASLGDGNELESPQPQLPANDSGYRKRPRSPDVATSSCMPRALRPRPSRSDPAHVVSSIDGAACTLQPPSPWLFGNDTCDSSDSAGERDGPDLMLADIDVDDTDHDDLLERFFAQNNDVNAEATAAAAAAGSGIAAAHMASDQAQPRLQRPILIGPSSSSDISSSYSGWGSGSEDEPEEDVEMLIGHLLGESAAGMVASDIDGNCGHPENSLYEAVAVAGSDHEDEDEERKDDADNEDAEDEGGQRSPTPALMLCSSSPEASGRAATIAACWRHVGRKASRKRITKAAAQAELLTAREGTLEPKGVRQQQHRAPSASRGRRPLRAAAAASVARAAALAGLGEDGELECRSCASIGVLKQKLAVSAAATTAAVARGRHTESALEAAAAAQVAVADRWRVATPLAGHKKGSAAAAKTYHHDHQRRQHQQYHNEHPASDNPPTGKVSSCNSRGGDGSDGKLVHIDHLKHQVADLLLRQRQLKAAGALSRGVPGTAAAAAAAAEVKILPEATGRKRSVVRRFLDYRSGGVQDRAVWAGLVSESFALVLPVAPYLSSGGECLNQGLKGEDGGLAGDAGTHRLCGIDALVRDTRAISRLVECINARCENKRPNQKQCNIRFVYHVAPGDTLVSGNRVMCHWLLSTEGLCAVGGLPRECAVDGMLRCRFDSRELLCSMEVTYDVLGFTQQLCSLGLLPGMPLPVPMARTESAPAAVTVGDHKKGRAPPLLLPAASMTPPAMLRSLHGHLPVHLKRDSQLVVSPVPITVQLGFDGSLGTGKAAAAPPKDWQYPPSPAEWHRPNGNGHCETSWWQQHGAACHTHVLPLDHLQPQ